jgi:arabinoxylan arabinofuranohydrolase
MSKSRKTKGTKSVLIVLISLFFLFGCSQKTTSDKDLSAYLFVYFTGNGPGEESIHYAVSQDGFNFRALNDNKPVLDSKSISSSGGARDPHILRAEDGKTFYMVATDLYVPEMGWKNYAMILMKSTDLIHWQTSVINIPSAFPEEFGDIYRVWAPQTIYDDSAHKYMVYFSMKQGDDPDKIYYAYANNEFNGLENAPKQLFFSPTNNACIDGDIIKKDGKYYLFFKSENGDPGIKLAISEKINSGYNMVSPERVDRETRPVEGSGIFKLNSSNSWILMYDVYTSGRYQFTKSNDLLDFQIVDNEVSMNFHPRHGTVMPITVKELKTLISTYVKADDILVKAESDLLKKQNIYFDGKAQAIHLPIKNGTDITAFDPKFKTYPGIEYTPEGPRDFSQGAVEYTFSISGKEKVNYKVYASENHNPVLEGFFADPEILWSEKTGKYYLYPTSDGFDSWSGYYFKAFSSTDLINWEDEGIILDLKKDVSWADMNAWAPCIVEKKINGDYKYFYYFTAGKKIGVAIADSPTGPFTDSGSPLIDFKPKGITGGQEIDPDVFTDPKSGKSYLYWGNGYMAVAELNPDMISMKKETLKILTPDKTFREGTYIFYRNGKYYVTWSEGDTRSEDYRVRYAFSDSPTGKWTIPENNIILAKDPENGIYGTGHNSVLQVPDKDEWYIVYHRFTYPKGIHMGNSAGFHRETCIDKLNFDQNGNILKTLPTHKGIAPLTKQ